MENLLILLAFPLAWPWIAKRIWHNDVTWQEMILNIVIVALLAGAVWQLGKNYMTADVEIWNGQVTGKEQEYTSCEHSYSCNCRTDSKGNRSCDTCYEHSNDWNWKVETTTGDFNIDRIDRRGSNEPPRWTAVENGQPVARAKTFTNYVKAVPQSLFNTNQQALSKYGAEVPAYPSGVYDYHYIDRIVAAGVNIPDVAAWNHNLAMMLRELGPSKQVNVIVVVTKNTDPMFEYALQGKWLGAKKNDVVVILGTPNYPEIQWVRIVSWTDKQLFKVQLRDELQDLKTVDQNKILGIINSNIKKSFVRKQMRDFEYLDSEILPPDWVIVLAVVIAVLGSILLSVFFLFYDVDLTRRHNIVLRRDSYRGRFYR